MTTCVEHLPGTGSLGCIEHPGPMSASGVLVKKNIPQALAQTAELGD